MDTRVTHSSLPVNHRLNEPLLSDILIIVPTPFSIEVPSKNSIPFVHNFDQIVNIPFLSLISQFDVSIFDGGKFCNAKKRTFIDNVDEIVNTSIFHFLSFVNFFEKEVYSNSMCPFLMEENFATRRKNREYVNFPLFR